MNDEYISVNPSLGGSQEFLGHLLNVVVVDWHWDLHFDALAGGETDLNLPLEVWFHAVVAISRSPLLRICEAMSAAFGVS